MFTFWKDKARKQISFSKLKSKTDSSFFYFLIMIK